MSCRLSLPHTTRLPLRLTLVLTRPRLNQSLIPNLTIMVFIRQQQLPVTIFLCRCVLEHLRSSKNVRVDITVLLKHSQILGPNWRNNMTCKNLYQFSVLILSPTREMWYNNLMGDSLRESTNLRKAYYDCSDRLHIWQNSRTAGRFSKHLKVENFSNFFNTSQVLHKSENNGQFSWWPRSIYRS